MPNVYDRFYSMLSTVIAYVSELGKEAEEFYSSFMHNS